MQQTRYEPSPFRPRLHNINSTVLYKHFKECFQYRLTRLAYTSRHIFRMNPSLTIMQRLSVFQDTLEPYGWQIFLICIKAHHDIMARQGHKTNIIITMKNSLIRLCLPPIELISFSKVNTSQMRTLMKGSRNGKSQEGHNGAIMSKGNPMNPRILEEADSSWTCQICRVHEALFMRFRSLQALQTMTFSYKKKMMALIMV